MRTSHFNQQILLVCGQDDSADEIFVDLLECGMSPTQLLDSFVYPAHLDVFAILVRLTFIKDGPVISWIQVLGFRLRYMPVYFGSLAVLVF